MPRLFGEKLHLLRVQHNTSQMALASRLGVVTQSHLSHLEAGRKAPSLELVIRLADIFSVRIDYLLRDDIPVDQPKPHQAQETPSQQSPPQLFGTKLRQLRQDRNMTQSVLADRLALTSHSHVSFIESQRKEPSINLVLQIADLFGVTTDYLLRDTIPIAPGAPSHAE
jgi:transcriptional regulator with XRE-family HTH domain